VHDQRRPWRGTTDCGIWDGRRPGIDPRLGSTCQLLEPGGDQAREDAVVDGDENLHIIVFLARARTRLSSSRCGCMTVFTHSGHTPWLKRTAEWELTYASTCCQESLSFRTFLQYEQMGKIP
jgi:hypothetical protein